MAENANGRTDSFETLSFLVDAINSMGDGFGQYKIEEGKIIPVAVSPKVGVSIGYTSEEYLERFGGDVTDSIHPADRQRVSSAILDIVAEGRTRSVIYRVLHKNGNYVWVNTIFSATGTKKGENSFYAVFLPIANGLDLQMELLNMADMAVHVIDAETYELYYSNDAGFTLLGQKPHDYRGQKCYEAIFGLAEPCGHCTKGLTMAGVSHHDAYVPQTGRIASGVSCIAPWNGRRVIVEYIADVTEQRNLERQMRALVDNAPGGLCLYQWKDERLVPLFLSDYFSQLIGADGRKRMSEDADLNFRQVHPDDLPGLKRDIMQGLRLTHSIDTTYRVRNEVTGKFVWIRAQVKCVPQEDGTQLCYTVYTDLTELKIAEAELAMVQKELEVAIGHAEMWYLTIDPETDTIKFDDGFLHDLPDYASAYDGQDVYDYAAYLIKPEYIHIFEESYKKIKNGAESVTFEARCLLRGGKERWLRFRVSNIFDKNSVSYKIICTAQRIDTEKLLEARLALEGRKAKLADETLLGYAIIDLLTSEIIEAKNYRFPKQCVYVGNTMEKAAACIAKDIIDENDRDAFLCAHDTRTLRTMYESGTLAQSCEYRHMTPDKNIMFVRNSHDILHDPVSDRFYLYDYFYDITQHRMLEEITDASLTSDYDVFALISTKNGQITMLQKAGKTPGNDKLLQPSSGDYGELARAFADKCVTPEDRDEYKKLSSLDYISEQLDKNGKFKFSCRMYAPDGAICMKRVRYTRYDKENDIIFMTRSDITEMFAEEEKKRSELAGALKLAEAGTRAKTSFLSRMSHELRTPMNAIMGITELAKNECDSDNMRKYLDKVSASSKFMLDLLNNILDMSSIESGRTVITAKPFSLAFVLENINAVTEALAQGKGISYFCENKAHSDAAYIGDVLHIKQILLNLTGNAVKFTPAGGEVRFSVSAEDIGAGSDKLRFTVADSGIGISKEFMKHMFEPFSQEDSMTTSQYGGVGLGLAISKNLADLMGGVITVESSDGKGSEFTFEIPLPRSEGSIEDAHDTIPALTKSVLKGRVVMLAEDSQLNAEIAKAILELRGVEVKTVKNGREAVDMFKNEPEGTFDAILMDIRMPVMDGIEAAGRIRAADRSDAGPIPIIALTANAFEEDRRRSIDAGINEHLAKPINAETLFKTLEEHIVRYRGLNRGKN